MRKTRTAPNKPGAGRPVNSELGLPPPKQRRIAVRLDNAVLERLERHLSNMQGATISSVVNAALAAYLPGE